ncbi:ribosome assembly cofactor RimP [Mangrovimonas sp. YM274]|uniref:ribosome assembly cofactor RimP n=1 Tax=Mangrovimonas sp. YM274 TaxID=3070660 RepID=UPI0027DBD65A|nr:ribosome assembly cofactor RimP [Mangrovimonas sp. YM274]WMI69381.1 ribosome assembly cofactor RimP [Mangrovimonas sp. YM274]
MFKDTVKDLLDKAFQEREDLFLIDFKIVGDNDIKVVIDGDNGVLVEDCIFVSRAVEHNLDREEEDFSLEVTSAGATTPFVHNRQYKKNVGRVLEIKTKDDQKLEGTLVDVDSEGITLEWKAREAKPVGKGKVTVKKEAQLKFDNILEAKVIIKF